MEEEFNKDRTEKRAFDKDVKAKQKQAELEINDHSVDLSSCDDKSSMNESDDSEMKKKGIDMDIVRRSLAGIQPDTSSDDECIPPKLGAVVNSPAADVRNSTVNPWLVDSGCTPSMPPNRI